MDFTNNPVTITKVTLTNFKEDLLLRQQMCGLELGFSEDIRPDGNFDHVREVPKLKLRNFFVHEDLVSQFVLISQHLAIIAEYKSPEDFDPDFDLADGADVCKHVFCTGATLTGSHEKAGVVLEGFKLLANGKKVKITAPNIEFAGFSGYKYEVELSEAIDDLSFEAMEAFMNRKRLVLQTELNFDETPSESAQEAPPRKPGGKVRVEVKAG